MNDNFLQSLETWCEKNDPRKANIAANSNNSSDGGVFMHSIVTGLDLKNNVITASENKVYTNKELCDACTTLIDMARISSGYNPQLPYADENQKNFNTFLKNLGDCPLLTIEFSESTHYNLSSKDANELVDEVANICTGIEIKDVDQVKDSIKKIVKSAFSHSKQEQHESFFTQGTLSADDKITYTNNLCNLSVVSNDKKGGKITSDQTDIRRVRVCFRSDLWGRYEDIVYNKHKQDVEHWVDLFRTPEGDKKVALTCFRRGNK
ncbi:hypothetical protein [Romboutsia ilealis]|uniref:hypothetical protein n=1 Tax=Romboutsia ilealis TaxID=1115758 RepID=UPI002573F9CC|nr:hypothetical protein [Romboutsia ilealis]